MSRQMEFKENVSMSPLTTLGVGGTARFAVELLRESDVAEAVGTARSRGLPFFVIGGGSNLLVADSGFDGVVLEMAIRGISAESRDGAMLVTAGAGEDWDGLVAWCVERKLQGLECLSGIPGTVGGAPIQNIGAYGQEVSQTIRSVRAFDVESGKLVEFDNAACGFSYRRSIFNSEAVGRFIIVGVTFLLVPEGPPTLIYPELTDRFNGGSPSLSEVREAVCELRRSKGMLVRQGGPDSRSAGSFFKNPIVDDEGRRRVSRTAEESGLGLPPIYPAGAGLWKVSAAWLIEKSGIGKGFRHGSAAVSGSHTLAIVNPGGATCRDIVALRDLIAGRVLETFGVELVQEPVFLGAEETASP